MKMHSLRRILLAVALAIATASWGIAPVFAMEEVIVTAQKREESVQEVPIAISVATAEQLARDQIYSLTDLQKTTPALEVNTTVGGESGGARIRGVGTNLFAEGASGSVAIVLDQVPSGNIAMPQIFDLAQVEVLKGPQGTLFGQTASLGVLNISTVAPDTEKFSANIGADYLWDDYDQTLVRGAINIPLSANTALRFAGRFRDEQGLQRNVALDRDNDIEEQAFRARIRSNSNDTLQIDLIAEYQEEVADGINFFGPAIPADQPAPLPFPPFSQSPETTNAGITACGQSFSDAGREYCSDLPNKNDKQWFSVTGILQWEPGDYALTSVSSFRKKEGNDESIDLSRVSGEVALAVFNTGLKAEQWSQEFRVASKFDAAFNYVAGVYVSDYEFDRIPTASGAFGDCANPIGTAFRVNSVPGGDCPIGPPTYTDDDVESSSQAVFFDGSYEVSDMLRLFGGLRYTEPETSFELAVDDAPVTQTGESESEEVTGRFGARWTLSDNKMVYASVSRGFKPSFVDVSDVPGAQADILKPEVSTAFEIGAKLSLMDGNMAVSANAFYTEIADFQAQSLGFVNNELVAIPTNIDIRTKGFEVEIRGSVYDNLSINTGFIYNSAEYPAGFLDDTGANIGGEQLAFSPETKFTLSGEYFQAVGNGIEAFVNLNAVHKGNLKLAARVDPDYRVDAHWNLGASLGVRSAKLKWRVALFGRNVPDEAEPISAVPVLVFGNDSSAVRVFPVGGITVRQLGIAFDVNF